MVENDLAVTLVQLDLVWEQPAENRAAIEAFLEKKEIKTDLIVLPEMFTTGFTMRAAAFAETMQPSKTLAWLAACAKKYGAAVIGSFIVTENEHFYNRLIFMRPDGTYEKYDKRHLFAKADEDKHYTRGTEKLVVTWRGWRIMPLICYDLRFPVWARNTMDYDLLVYVANWPQRRHTHWRSLLVARAIENQCYTIGVNRVGNDNTDLYHLGGSAVIDPYGERQAEVNFVPCLVQETLSADYLIKTRRELPFLKDIDS